MKKWTRPLTIAEFLLLIYFVVSIIGFAYLKSIYPAPDKVVTESSTPVVAKPYEPGEVYVQELNLFDGKLYRIYDVDADGTCWVTVSPTGASRAISCLRGNHGNNKAISE